MNLDAKAELRAAIRRLMQAVRKDGVEVVVLRKDLDLCLALVASNLEESSAPATAPRLHPAQR